MSAAYVELAAASNFSFLHGASHGSDMLARALALGHAGLGIADRNTVAGVVRVWKALKDKREEALVETGEPLRDFKLVTGARLIFADGTPDIIAYPETRHGWGRLCRLLSTGNLRADKGDCVLKLDDLLAHLDGLLLIVLPASTRREGEGIARKEDKQTHLPDDEAEQPSLLSNVIPAKAGIPLPAHGEEKRDSRVRVNDGAGGDNVIPFPTRAAPDLLTRTLTILRAAASDRIWLGAAMRRSGADHRRIARLARLARETQVPLLAINDALYAAPEDRPLQDVLTAIRLGITVREGGKRFEANAERHLKAPAEMARLLRDHPGAIEETLRFHQRIQFDLAHLKYEYPHEPVPRGKLPFKWLKQLVGKAAAKRWPKGLPDNVRAMLKEEFALLGTRPDLPYYFLTVHDLVRFARSQGILCQGRGSAANSMVCYLLGITAVDPAKHDLLFSRFMSADREEPPDIDVDFEHERREEVMQYVYRRYGRHRAGIVATVIHYRSRSTVREVGKALGLTEDVTTRLVSTVWGSYATQMEEERFKETGFDLHNPEIERLNHFVAKLLEAPFPRHLSQHVGGYVLTEHRLDETVPIHHAAMEDRTFIEWDKDDIDAIGLMKVDVLALGMLTCIRKAFDLIRDFDGTDYELRSLPEDQADVYAMLQKGDSVGVFQVESRAQINMLPRLRPENLYDLVVQVAIVRPGPIQGNMVHPYLRRRQKIEKVDYPSPAPPHDPNELRGILGKTLGVPLFQEQAMKLAIVAAAFTPGEANQLRRAMATFRNVGTMPKFEKKMVGGMTARGYSEEFARRCFDQIKGFGSYGFPESHALSFALLVYVSAFLKKRHPAAFCAALLNSQPMGFYAPAQIVGCARDHDVEVREIDAAFSDWDNKLEPGDGAPAVRLGFRQIDGFKEEWAEKIMATRGAVAPGNAGQRIEALARAGTLPSRALRLLADADAFRSFGHDRREALWEVRRTPADALPLFAAADARELGQEEDPQLPAMPLSEHVAADYQTTRLSLKAHPMSFLRTLFATEGVLNSKQVREAKDGTRAKVAGVVLVRQRPGEGKAIFITLEDETGVTNVLLWARDFEKYRRPVMASRLMEVHGIIQKSDEGVVHLMGAHVVDRTAELERLSEDHPTRVQLSRADVFEHPQMPRHAVPRGSHPRNVRILPPSRDFH
ncbi:MAG TPA: error-prone DNA polymerase [Sphingomonas sp.]|uniref:error-prone DNA polymerase n=1 Tax=Sphingomonas sp. TaxID=28214 RepID=UPI002CEC91F0|nr:error-prone DNA polymerase [Sphingomonas sp.]HMI18827.1 error-prone DNA polymerase [Sphingomonas sp.]